MSYQEKPLVSVKTRRYLRKILPRSVYLRYFGRHEHMSIKLWRVIAAKVPAEFVILDIGAFNGEFAVAAREVNELTEIFAFEPNPESLKILKTVCNSNQIHLVDNALSNKNEIVHFTLNSRTSSISKDFSNVETVKVNAITLDSWVEQKDKIPYAINIDAEDSV